jgi:hypothetical protein
MDPYLVAADVWPLFHDALIECLAEILRPGLCDRYLAHIEERRYHAPGEHCEKYIQVIQKSDNSLVTLIDLVSPLNKTTSTGREAYLGKRREAKEASANIVEIDLVLGGKPMLDYSREGLPDWDYAVTVTRATQPERYEIYTAVLGKRLPRFRLPLAKDDHDTVVDLQAALERAFDRAGCAARINYQNPPPVLRERIAAAAYQLWELEGCPHGRDEVHWNMAVEQLGRPRK